MASGLWLLRMPQPVHPIGGPGVRTPGKARRTLGARTHGRGAGRGALRPTGGRGGARLWWARAPVKGALGGFDAGPAVRATPGRSPRERRAAALLPARRGGRSGRSRPAGDGPDGHRARRARSRTVLRPEDRVGGLRGHGAAEGPPVRDAHRAARLRRPRQGHPGTRARPLPRVLRRPARLGGAELRRSRRIGSARAGVRPQGLPRSDRRPTTWCRSTRGAWAVPPP